jgi:hypothetical protein
MKKLLFAVLVSLSLTAQAKPKHIPATAVPEPEAYSMMLAGLAIVGYAARRKISRKG